MSKSSRFQKNRGDESFFWVLILSASTLLLWYLRLPNPKRSVAVLQPFPSLRFLRSRRSRRKKVGQSSFPPRADNGKTFPPILSHPSFPFHTFISLPRLVLDDSQGVESVLLGELGLDLVDQGTEVGDVLLLGGPLVLGQELVGERELGGAADAVDAVVRLLGAQALEGGEDGLVLLGDEVVGAVFGEGGLVSLWVVGRLCMVW